MEAKEKEEEEDENNNVVGGDDDGQDLFRLPRIGTSRREN